MAEAVDSRAVAAAALFAKLATAPLDQTYCSMAAKSAYLSIIPQGSFTMGDRRKVTSLTTIALVSILSSCTGLQHA